MSLIAGSHAINVQSLRSSSLRSKSHIKKPLAMGASLLAVDEKVLVCCVNEGVALSVLSETRTIMMSVWRSPLTTWYE